MIGEREVELIGPPLSSFVIRAYPLLSGDSSQRNGAVALVEESTERRRLDQVRRDFVANISHELRTPIGAVGLLAETIRDESDPEVVDRLSARMISEAERVTATIEDLLELSRIEFGEGMAIGLVPLRDIVAEAVARIGTAAEQRGVSIDTRASGRPRRARRPPSARVGRLQPDRQRGEVQPRPRRRHGRGRGRGPRARTCRSIDRGIGIPSRDVDRVFERFYRVDRARSRGTGGTGLGLAIVRHVVSNHGGEIRVSSREGEGSTFSLALPIAAADSRPGRAERRRGRDPPTWR